MTVPSVGSLLALDWGQKKVGYATADELGLVVTPRGHWQRRSSADSAWNLSGADLKQLKQLVNDYDPGAFVLGLPLLADGRDSEASKKARLLAVELKSALGKEVYLVNEVLSSWASKNAKDEDAEAAALLLRDFLSTKNRGGRGHGSASEGGFSMLKFLVTLCFFALLICGAGAGWLYYGFSIEPASPGKGQVITLDVPPQSTLRTVRTNLEKQGVKVDRLSFKVWTYLHPEANRLKIGEYSVQSNWSAAHILDEIVGGHPLLHSLTMKEGYNIYDLQAELKQPEVPSKWAAEFHAVVTDPKYLERMQLPSTVDVKLRSLEGFLFPETYSFQKYDTLRTVIEAMLGQFEKRALPILQSHPWAKTPGGIYRLLTLASIVEKESGAAAEQPTVASVFWNRIKKHMKLQSDPTTIYGLLPNYDGHIHRINLTTFTPYNTYTVPELPAGPISNPGETALKAVVNPAQTEFLYFVSKGDGTHIFAKDLQSHNANVAKYQLGAPLKSAQKSSPKPPRR